MLTTFTPGGFEKMLVERGEVARTFSPQSPEFATVMAKYLQLFPGEFSGSVPVRDAGC